MTHRFSIKISKELINTAKNGNLEILKLIVNSCKQSNKNSSDKDDIDVSWVLVSDKKGRNLLHIASKHGFIDIVDYIRKAIYEATTDKKLRKEYLDIADFKGRTALFYASAEGHAIVSYLIDREANINKNTISTHIAPGSTPLMAAAERNNLKCFESLLDGKASIQCQRRDGADALYLASRHGNYEVIKILAINDHMEKIINRETFHGRTAILTAALNGHLEACKLLHSSGANLNYQDNDKFTALILASNEGHYNVSEWLVINGADISRKDRHGGTALDAALAHGFSEIVNLLIKSQENLEYGSLMEKSIRIVPM